MSDVTLQLGDCLELMRALPDASIDAIVTDPPYGIDYQSAWRTEHADWKPKIKNDTRPFIWFLYDAYRVLREGGVLLCFCRWDIQESFRLAIEWTGLTIKSQVIWDRDWHGMGDLDGAFAPQHDVIWFATKGKFSFQGPRPVSVIRSRRIAAEALAHPNEKPMALMYQLVNGVTQEGDMVLDPFMGSGKTGVACVRLNRHFIGMEIDPTYFKIAEQRIAAAQSQMNLPLDFSAARV